MLALTSFGQSVLARKNTVNILELFYRENGIYSKRTSKTGLRVQAWLLATSLYTHSICVGRCQHDGLGTGVTWLVKQPASRGCDVNTGSNVNMRSRAKTSSHVTSVTNRMTSQSLRLQRQTKPGIRALLTYYYLQLLGVCPHYLPKLLVCLIRPTTCLHTYNCVLKPVTA